MALEDGMVADELLLHACQFMLHQVLTRLASGSKRSLWIWVYVTIPN